MKMKMKKKKELKLKPSLNPSLNILKEIIFFFCNIIEKQNGEQREKKYVKN